MHDMHEPQSTRPRHCFGPTVRSVPPPSNSIRSGSKTPLVVTRRDSKPRQPPAWTSSSKPSVSYQGLGTCVRHASDAHTVRSPIPDFPSQPPLTKLVKVAPPREPRKPPSHGPTPWFRVIDDETLDRTRGQGGTRTDYSDDNDDTRSFDTGPHLSSPFSLLPSPLSPLPSPLSLFSPLSPPPSSPPSPTQPLALSRFIQSRTPSRSSHPSEALRQIAKATKACVKHAPGRVRSDLAGGRPSPWP